MLLVVGWWWWDGGGGCDVHVVVVGVQMAVQEMTEAVTEAVMPLSKPQYCTTVAKSCGFYSGIG